MVNNKSNNDLVSSLSHLTTSETTLNSVNNLGCALYSGAGYTINLALWVFNSEMPIRIAAIGKTDKNGKFYLCLKFLYKLIKKINFNKNIYKNN